MTHLKRYSLLPAFLMAMFWAVATHAQGSQVVVLEVSGAITQATANYVERGLNAADRDQATALVIVLNTPGGGLGATLEIVQRIRQSGVPVIVYVAPAGAQAASAGSLITVAGHAAGMAPETIIGAASPVMGSGEDIPDTLYRKQVEDLKATMRSLTERRGEPAVALAEAMIEEARAVHANEALAAGLIDVVAPSLADLLERLDGRTVEVAGEQLRLQTAGAPLRTVGMNSVERVLQLLSDATVISILLVIGVQAILIELSSPGGWFAGLLGILCLALALYGAGQIEVNWLGFGLVLIAFILFLAEVKAATHGALAAAGTATLIAGLLVLFNSPGSPEFARISIPAAIAISLSTAAFFVFAVTMALRAQRRPPLTGAESMIGQSGLVRQPLEKTSDPAGPYRGLVFVMGELWRAAADEPIEAGAMVVIIGVSGFTLQVQRLADDTAPAPAPTTAAAAP